MNDPKKLLSEMIEKQEQKVMQLAQDIIPHITPEDLRNPQDFPELEKSSLFNYEDGILSGLKSVQMALRQL